MVAGLCNGFEEKNVHRSSIVDRDSQSIRLPFDEKKQVKDGADSIIAAGRCSSPERRPAQLEIFLQSP